MAIYTYRCKECGATAEVVQSIKSYCEAPDVPFCPGVVNNDHEGGKMERYLTPPMFALDIAPWAAYQSPIDGSVITSRAERNEHMAKHGVVLFDDIAPDIERNKKQRLKDATADIKQDMIDATHRVEAGYVPKVDSVDNFVPAE